MSTATENGALAEQDTYNEEVIARGGAMQQIRTSHATAVAVQRPRALARSCRQLEEEARLSGERFYYGWSAGGEKIEGPSIKLAKAAARCWGNCAVELAPVQDLPDAWVFTAVFVDLETGFTLHRQFRQSKKHIVYGKHDEARKEDIRFQIGQSKAVRNVILNALPEGLIDAAMEAAKSGVRQKIEKFIAECETKEGKGKGIVKVVDLMLRDLAKHGVVEARVLAKLGIADRKAIDVDNLVILSGDRAALNDGEARAEELYPVDGAKERAASYKADDPPAKSANGAQAAPMQRHARAIEEAETATDLDRAYAAMFDDETLKKGDRARLATLHDERKAALAESRGDNLFGGTKADERERVEATK